MHLAYSALTSNQPSQQQKEPPVMGCTLKDSFESTLPTDRKKQKPQIDFLRFLCYNKNNNLKEDKEDAYERCD